MALLSRRKQWIKRRHYRSGAQRFQAVSTLLRWLTRIKCIFNKLGLNSKLKMQFYFLSSSCKKEEKTQAFINHKQFPVFYHHIPPLHLTWMRAPTSSNQLWPLGTLETEAHLLFAQAALPWALPKAILRKDWTCSWVFRGAVTASSPPCSTCISHSKAGFLSRL